MLREGSEVVLFLYGVAASDGGSALSLTIGGVLGLLLGGTVCLLTYLGLVRIPPRALFATTIVLITLLAAAMRRRQWVSMGGMMVLACGSPQELEAIRQQLGDAHLPLTRLRRLFFAKGIKTLQYSHNLR